jgi:hypothetical protein
VPGIENKIVMIEKGEYDIEDIKTACCDNLVSLLKK